MSDQSQGNKTEKPTHKRLEDARKKGNFLFSEFVVQLATLMVGTCAVYFIMSDLPQRFDRALVGAIVLGQNGNFGGAMQNFLVILAQEVLPPTAMIMGVVCFFSIASNISQVGFVFQGAKLTRGLEMVNPVTNAKNLFSKHTLTNFILSIIKVLIVCFVTYKLLIDDKALVNNIYAHRLDVMGASIYTGEKLWRLCMTVLASLVPIAILDYALKAYYYQKDNMMSKDEVQREHKEAEGDPKMKSQRKAMGRELVEGMDRLPNASAVIRNPTHIAVVVRYEPSVAPVPYITLMETDNLAMEIIHRAKQLGIPLYEDVPLARALYATGEVDTHMPLELSEKIVPFVYWLQAHHPERVYDRPEFSDLDTRIGNVKR
jgi:type III secretion protein U